MKREEILESARTCVCTDRNKQYGAKKHKGRTAGSKKLQEDE